MDVTGNIPEIAVRLSQKAQSTGLTATDLQQECPWICRQIIKDANTSGLFDFWGDSSNLDELAGVAIVEPRILAAIGELAGVSMHGPGVHAGIQHTYGYLLSTIVTPYGYKRDRWVTPWLEQGFGLPSDVLGPNPSQGTLLSNATVFAGSIAFRGDKRSSDGIRRIAPSAADAVCKLDFKQFEQTRIVEMFSFCGADGRFGSIRIRTDLVPFLHEVEGCVENHLLVYSVEDGNQQATRLTTLFPVTPKFVAEMTDPARFGPALEIRTRFNAFIQDVENQTFIGERTLKRFHRPHRWRGVVAEPIEIAPPRPHPGLGEQGCEPNGT